MTLEHTDYAGIATLIAAIAAAVVSILTAVQSFRNTKKIDEVHKVVNGQMEARVKDAMDSGVALGLLATVRRGEDPSVPPEHRPQM